jgi:hypothetical protein
MIGKRGTVRTRRAPGLARVGVAGLVVLLQAAAHADDAGETWRVTHSRLAPWYVADPSTLSAQPDLTGRMLTIAADALRGPGMLDCAPTRVERIEVPAEGLFEGNLPGPAENSARALGFSTFPVAGIRVTCANAGFDFHFADAESLLFGLDNRVWFLSRAPGATAAPDSPPGVVQRLLETHFGGDLGFTPASVAAKSTFLSAALRRAMDAYFARPFPEDEAPDIDGDPFTDSQEYPARFAVGAAAEEGGFARVPVRFADGWREYTLEYRLVQEDGGWRLDDVTDGTGASLRALLQDAR